MYHPQVDDKTDEIGKSIDNINELFIIQSRSNNTFSQVNDANK